MANIQSHLDNIKNAERGESVRDAVCAALKAINEDNPVVTKPLSVTQNGTYTGEGGIAYNPVTVNVEGGGQSGIAFDALNVTENGYYEPNEGHAYIGVNVNVPQQTSELGEKIIEENGVYDPADDGLDGYSKIYVQTGQTGGPFTVKFYDGQTLLAQVDNVPFGGGATYPGGNPTASGMVFAGWNPNPLNVRANMECQARFVDAGQGSTISDSWREIARNVQNNPAYYPLGSTKTIALGDDGTGQAQGMITMQLVGIGIDEIWGSNGYAPTTWLAKQPLKSMQPMVAAQTIDPPHPRDDQLTYEDSWLRLYLSSSFFNNSFPEELRPYVKTVTKYSKSYDINTDTFIRNAPSANWIWIPSMHELVLPENYQWVFDYEVENMGPNYNPTGEELLNKFFDVDTITATNSNGIKLRTAVKKGKYYFGNNELYDAISYVSFYKSRSSSYFARYYIGEDLSAFGNNLYSQEGQIIFGFCI